MEPIEEFRYLILALQREGNRLFAAELRPLGVTPSQAEVLRVLGEWGPLTLQALGEMLVCETGSSPSRLVDRLVAQGLVDRGVDPDDRRRVALSLTGEGRELMLGVKAAERRLHSMLARFADDDALDPALDVLRRVAEEFPSGHAVRRRRGDRDGTGASR